MSNEAWKDTGKCIDCRRKPYCKKQCRARKEYVRRICKKAFLQTPTGQVFTEMNRQVGEDEQNRERSRF